MENLKLDCLRKLRGEGDALEFCPYHFFFIFFLCSCLVFMLLSCVLDYTVTLFLSDCVLLSSIHRIGAYLPCLFLSLGTFSLQVAG